jgi:hypothetical protein
MIVKNYLSYEDIEIKENKINVFLSKEPQNYVDLKNGLIKYFGNIQKIKTNYEKPSIVNEFEETFDNKEYIINVVDPILNEEAIFKSTNNLIYLNLEKIIDSQTSVIEEKVNEVMEILNQNIMSIDSEVKPKEYDLNLKKLFSIFEYDYIKEKTNFDENQFELKKRQINLVQKYKNQILLVEYPETLMNENQKIKFIKYLESLENTTIIIITNQLNNIINHEKYNFIFISQGKSINPLLIEEHKYLFKLNDEKYFNIVKKYYHDIILLNDIEQQVLSDLK